MHKITLALSAAEHHSVVRVSADLRLTPAELLWCGLDSVMGSIDQSNEALGCVLDTVKRFDRGELPEWAQDGKEVSHVE